MIEELKEFFSEYRQETAFVLLFLTAQLFVVAAKWGRPLIWDSNVYVGMGKAIFSGWQYGLWESFRPVILPIISGFFWFLGIPVRNFPRVIGLLFATIGLTVFYSYAREFMDRERAITGLFLLGSTFIYVKWSTYFLTGIPASILVLLAIYMVGKKRFYIGGMLSGLAFLTRFPAALVGPAVMFYFLVQLYMNRDIEHFMKKSGYYATGVLTLAVPFMLFNQVMYGDILHPIISGALIPAGNPEKYLLGIWYIAESIKSGYIILSASMILAPLGIYSALKKNFEGNLLPAVTLVAFYGFFSFYPHKLVRFMVLLLPLIVYFAAEAVHFSLENLSRWNNALNGEKVYWVVRIILVLVLVVASYGLYDVNTWENTDRQDFLEESSSLNGTVVSNTPEIVPYSDFRYIPVRPENMQPDDILNINSCTSERDTGFCKASQDEIDYVVISNRSWYCTPAIDSCQQKIDRFESEVKKVFETKYNMTGPKSRYLIYGRE